MKKLFAMGTIVLTLGLSSVMVFAAPGGQKNNPQGTGRGNGGTGQGLGIGGMMLQDGSCFYLGEDGNLYYTATNELVPEDVIQAAVGKGGCGLKLRDGSCYLLS